MLVRIEFILSNPRPWLPTVQSYISALSEILTHQVPKLEKIQICGPCGFLDPSSEISRLLSRLVKTHGERLKRISVHRMDVDLEVIKDICVNCSALEELFIAVEPDKLVSSCLLYDPPQPIIDNITSWQTMSTTLDLLKQFMLITRLGSSSQYLFFHPIKL